MVLFPKGGLGRVLLSVIIISTLSYLVLNIVSFAGARWITYVDVPIRFGLWKVCDTSQSGLCSQWSDDQYASTNITNTFDGSKPSYVRSSQALEIISLVFYIFAAAFIIVGIIDLDGFPFEMAFIAAAGLLFICIIFISASLGLMSVQGRSNHPGAFLDWAWWNGLVGLIMTIICFFTLIALIVYMNFSSTSSRKTFSKKQKGSPVNGWWGQSGSNSMGMVGNPSPFIPSNQTFIYPNSNNQYSQQYNPNDYWQQNNLNQFYQNPMMVYGGPSPAEQYFSNQSPSPIISNLALQYVTQANDAQYQNQLLDPYKQYLHDPYLIHNYL